MPTAVVDGATAVALDDEAIGPVLASEGATLVFAEPWQGEDGEPIGVVLEYRLGEAVDLPKAHGEILETANPEMGTAGLYEPNGLPTKTNIGSSGSYGRTELVDIFIASGQSSVYAIQPMGDAEDQLC